MSGIGETGMRGIILAALTAATAISLGVMAGAAPPPPLPADAARGERLFDTGTCHGCHGVQGVYPVGPSMVGPPLIGPKWKYGGDAQSLFSSIHDGRPLWMKAKGGMNLTDGQIRDIVHEGSRKARTIAQATMQRVRDAVKLRY